MPINQRERIYLVVLTEYIKTESPGTINKSVRRLVKWHKYRLLNIDGKARALRRHQVVGRRLATA